MARQHEWMTCHLDYRDGGKMVVVSGKGFPDLVMFRENPESGQMELVVAELKRGPDSKPFSEQQEWLDAFERTGVYARVWRPENWDEIERVLERGPANADLEDGASPRPERKRSNGRLPSNPRVITDLAETIEDDQIPSGAHAGLRRMNPANPNLAIFWKLMARKGMPQNPDIAKWGLIIHGMALMSHRSASSHNEGFSVGRALYEGGGKRPPFYSEDRLATLLTARSSTLHRLLARLFRMLGNEGRSFNWREMAYFILHEGENHSKAEESRIKIARDYYKAESQASRSTNNDK